MTADFLAAFEKTLERMTPGEWEARPHDMDPRNFAFLSCVEWERECFLDLERRDDAEGIAFLRNETPKLVALCLKYREALESIPTQEYGEAFGEGCDADGAWDCFREALDNHVRQALTETGEK